MPGRFIDVKVANNIASETVAKLIEVCPVDIFERAKDGALRIAEDNLAECVLCDLCVEAAPKGSVEVVKLYE